MDKKKQKNKINYKAILGSVREYKKPSIQAPLFIAFEALLETFIPFIMAEMIDNMTGSTMGPILKYGLVLVFLALSSLLFGVLSGKAGARAATGFAKNLRHDLFDKVQDFSFAEIDKFSTSSLVTRLTTDVTNVQNAYSMLIRIAIRTPLVMIFAFIMSTTISWRLAIIFIIIIPILAVGFFLIIRKVLPVFRRIFKKYDKLNSTVQENVSGIRVVKSFVREDYEKNKFHIAADDLRHDFTKVERTIALTNPLMMFAVYVSIILISYLGATTIINSVETVLSIGELSSLITYSTQILMSVMMLSMVFVMISMSLESINRISEVLTTDSSLSKNDDGIKDIKDGSISFKDVCFEYKKGSNKYALKDISLDIKSGSTIGILGSTGSAKTTLIQLIPRLYDTSVGNVFVGGKNVNDYNLESLRDNVAVVLQKNVLFSGTVKENLRWGNKNATDEELVEVCKLACADEFIQQMPDKYDTHIERGGSNVSGGQKQRLCIARAILKKPKIIIFDDSTSAVDTKTDALIREAMNMKIPNTTKIIISQRLNSVEEADNIFVMAHGQIQDSGTHLELMAKSRDYKETYIAQTSGKGGSKDE
jgi:ATP-binding cassette subfamily B protein